MSLKEPHTEKLYYSIGEVAKLLNVNTSLIRFWEKEFDRIKPKKNKKGNRMFTPKDLETLRLIHHLVKERGYTLQGAKDKMRQNKEDVEHNFTVVEKLKDIKKTLLDIRSALDS